jgi:hypothetical protein
MNTPRMDAWIANLQRELRPRGRKTALARFLADASGKSVKIMQITIVKWLKRVDNPNGESVLAITEWISKNRG